MKREKSDNERAASMIEYALLLALVAIVAIGALTALGRKIPHPFCIVQGGFDGDGLSHYWDEERQRCMMRGRR